MALYINSLVVETTGSLLGQLDMNNNLIANVATPLTDLDAANKLYVDTLVAGATGAETLEQILAAGNSAGTYQIDMNNNAIVNVATPIVSGDAANKEYVDNQLALETLQTVTSRGATSDQTLTLTNPGTGLIIEGDLVVMGTTRQVNVISYTETVSSSLLVGDSLMVNGDVVLGDANTDTVTLNGKTYYAEVPTADTEVTNKLYVDTLVAGATGAESLAQTLAAGNTAGAFQIDMNSNNIVNLLDPLLATDAANKNYVDTVVAAASGAETLAQTLAAGNSAGANQLDMNSNNIINVATPSATGDAVNKQYVDSLFSVSLQRGTVTGATFAGTPKTASVTLATPYSDTTYAVTISTGANRIITVSNKTVSGFTLDANADTAFTESVDWVTFGA